MSDVRHRRLRAPLLTAAVGAALAVATALAANWVAALPVAAITAVTATAYWLLGGTDTDVGALMGARADERQTAVRLWVRAFAAASLLVLATVGGVVSAALHRTAWPYALIVGLGAACFLGALAFYRTGGSVGGSGLRAGLGDRLDERQAAIVLHALQLAGIVMFVVAAIGGAALGGRSGADPLRFQAIAFALAVIVGFALFRPRHDGV